MHINQTLDQFKEQTKKAFFAVHEPGMHPDNIFLSPFEEYLLEDLYHKRTTSAQVFDKALDDLQECVQLWR